MAATPTPLSDHRQFAVFQQVGQILGPAETIEGALEEVLELLCCRLGMRLATLSLVQGNGGEPVEIAHGMSHHGIGSRREEIVAGMARRVIQTGKLAVAPRISGEAPPPDPTDAPSGPAEPQASLICVPIVMQGEIAGTLSVDAPYLDDVSLQAAVRLLTAVAGMVAQDKASRLRAARGLSSLMDENTRLQDQIRQPFRPAGLIGNSRQMRDLGELIARLAPSDDPVTIRGECGAGKGLVADALHCSGPRASTPLVTVHTGSLSGSLLEAELFGPTLDLSAGVGAARPSRFEQAHSGTLFLDGIGDLSPGAQGRLVRALQAREIERVGSTKSIRIDVRIIAATSNDLERAFAEGRLRDDLYRRLNASVIHVPPLREHKSDLPLLADTFVERYAARHSREVKRISPRAIEMLMAYHWPGNVRELQDGIEHAVLRTNDSVLHSHHLPLTLQTAASSGTASTGSLEMMMASYEREILVEALTNTRGNMAKAARLLDTTPRIFAYRTRKLDVDPRSYRH